MDQHCLAYNASSKKVEAGDQELDDWRCGHANISRKSEG